MIFLSIVSLLGILFLLNTLWNLFRDSRENRTKRNKAQIIQFEPRTSSRLSEAATRNSAGKAV